MLHQFLGYISTSYHSYFQYNEKQLDFLSGGAVSLTRYPNLLDADDVPQDDDVNNGTV